MKKLTERQKEIWDLHKKGVPRNEMAEKLGVEPTSIGNALTTIRKKLAKMGKDTKEVPRGTGNTLEIQSPETVAAAIDAASNPNVKTQREAIAEVNKTLKLAGVPQRVSEALIRRIKVKCADVIEVKKRLTRDETMNMLDENIALMGSYIDPAACASATVRDLAMSIAALIEKKQLLSGAPTQIFSNEQRNQLEVLFPKVLAEAKRRGLTVEGEVVARS